MSLRAPMGKLGGNRARGAAAGGGRAAGRTHRYPAVQHTGAGGEDSVVPPKKKQVFLHLFESMILLTTTLLCVSLGAVGSAWRVTANLGALAGAAPASLSTPPLAMFTPGGGRAATPSWFAADWATSGSRLVMPLDCTFGGERAAAVEEGALRRAVAGPRVLAVGAASFASMAGPVPVVASGVAWGLTEISAVESLLVWCADLPGGVALRDVSLPPGTRLFFSTRCWRGDEAGRLRDAVLPPLRRELEAERAYEETLRDGVGALRERVQRRRALEARVAELERGLPPEGATTADVAEGPLVAEGRGRLLLAREGQLSVKRLAPRGLRNAWPGNPFEQVAEYGVVGSFQMREMSTTDNPSSRARALL